jgi:hypothetical protein
MVTLADPPGESVTLLGDGESFTQYACTGMANNEHKTSKVKAIDRLDSATRFLRILDA